MVETPPILPPLQPVTPGPTPIGQQQNPPQLPQLPAGTVLQGTVSGQDAKGNLIIQTDTLRLVLQTSYPVAKGQNIGIRLEQTLAGQLSKQAPPIDVRIVSVDGKAPPAAHVPSSNPQQAELAKPVGVLLDMMTRSAPSGKAAGEGATPPQPVASQAPARGVALEVNLSDGLKTQAVLLRPATDPGALTTARTLLTQLATPQSPQQQTALPAPATILRPGLQLQVQLVLPTTPTVTPQTQPPATLPSASPIIPGAIPGAATPTASPQPPATNGPAPQAPLQLTPGGQAPIPGTDPFPAPAALAARNGYAAYGRQSPAMMSPAMQNPPPQNPAVQANPAPVTTAAPLSPSASPVSGIPSTLSPQVVEQLLAQTEMQRLPPGQVAAVALGKDSAGGVIMHTRLGTFTLPNLPTDSIAPGTPLQWQVKALTPPPATEALQAVATPKTALASAIQLTAEWSALSELTSVLQSMQSSMAAQALQRLVPHIGNNFSAGLLFFINVLRKGDIGEWLGRDVVKHLERIGKSDLVPRLGTDIAAVRSLFTEQQPGNWQALFFPVMVDRQLEHAQLFLKQEAQDKKEGGAGTRFVVELDLSNLGPMQMDGFIKKRESATQFDLVIRTLGELPDDIRTDIHAIYDKAQQATGMHGSLNFRQVHEFPVHPLDEMQGQSGEEGSIMA